MIYKGLGKAIDLFIDTFTTGVFFTAMWLMANKKIENWTLWIFADIITIPLIFCIEVYGFIRHTIFNILTILAIQAYLQWKKSLNSNPQQTAVKIVLFGPESTGKTTSV